MMHHQMAPIFIVNHSLMSTGLIKSATFGMRTRVVLSIPAIQDSL